MTKINIEVSEYQMLNKIRNAEDELVPNILFNEGGADAASFRRFLQQEGLMNDPDAMIMLRKLEELEVQRTPKNASPFFVDIDEYEFLSSFPGVNKSTFRFLEINERNSRLSNISEEEFYRYMKEERRDVFEELYKLYAEPLRQYVSDIQNKFSAEDMVQLAFMQIWGRHAVIISLKDFRSQLFMVARNLIIDASRKKNLEENLERAYERATLQKLTENDAFSKSENIMFFVTAISGLSKVMRMVIEYRLEGRTIKETAQVLDIGESQVRAHWEEALQILRKKYESRPKKR